MECAGRAERRRRFGIRKGCRDAMACGTAVIPDTKAVSLPLVRDCHRSPYWRGSDMECAGRAKRRRRFGIGKACRDAMACGTAVIPDTKAVSLPLVRDCHRSPYWRGSDMECAGRAKRRRRFGIGKACRDAMACGTAVIPDTKAVSLPLVRDCHRSPYW